MSPVQLAFCLTEHRESLSSMPLFSEWTDPLEVLLGTSKSSGTRSSRVVIRGNSEPGGVVQLRRGDKYILVL